MSDNVLRKVVFLDGITVSTTSPWFDCDFKYAPDQIRTIIGTMAAADSAIIEGTLDNPYVAVPTYVTIETTTGATSFIYNVLGPWGALRVRKTGAAGAMTVKGIV